MLIMAELALVVIWFRLAVLSVLGLAAARRRMVSTAAQPTGDIKVRASPPHISVVVPAFNEEAIIESTLQKLLAQDLAPWEIIVVDDGSTDATAELARRGLAAFEYGRVIELETNLGKPEALNIGIRVASGELVATIDADTLLEQDALRAAVDCLYAENADAVALYIDVDNSRGLLGRLQRQEYVAALNFERAGQDVIGAISILPGAATMFRREALRELAFSRRTQTEDADLTLHLARRGARLVLAANAVAKTVVPAKWGDLVAQRVRWTAGHLQCCAAHANDRCGARPFFTAVVFPNFVLSSTIIAVGFFATLAIVLVGRTQLLGLDWVAITLVSVGLVYLQRVVALAVDFERRPRLVDLVLEPLVSGLIGAVSFVGALYVLLPVTLAARPIVPLRRRRE
ncbi:MAG: glycosyltransferase family 2 protein [Hyphomicrobium aestuarii]|nr:glycosyltransferase family 2 protein [Hyphomicrobium aestuarii]